MERPQPRTLLEWLIQESDCSLEEVCQDFDRCARDSKERKATLSVRQLSRWMAGEVEDARPESRRVAQRLWGHSFKELLGLPNASAEVIAQVGEIATAVKIISKEEVPQESGKLSASLQEEVVMAAEESARFVRRAGVAVTPEALEQLDADVKWLAVEYLCRPPYAVFRSLATL